MNHEPKIETRRRSNGLVVLSGAMICACFAAASAQAEWRVVDNKGNTHLENIKDRLGEGDVNENLTNLYNQQKIDKFKSSEHTKKADDPDEVLDKEKPSTQVEIGADKRCPQPPLTSGAVGQQQYQLCNELVTTELAKYKYSMKMYEVTSMRNKRLEEIENERKSIGENDHGKLQDNSNKLLALLSRMEIDRQQQKTYMDAYDARLQYLTAARDTLTKQAMEGDKSLTSAAITLAASAAMATALNGLETDRSDWRQYRR